MTINYNTRTTSEDIESFEASGLTAKEYANEVLTHVYNMLAAIPDWQDSYQADQLFACRTDQPAPSTDYNG